jgi:fructose-1-phosphate kinase PfkB-like protein
VVEYVHAHVPHSTTHNTSRVELQETDHCPRYSAVGAGDTFIAGILYGLICHPDDWSTGKKLTFAVQLATLKVQREGFDGLGVDMLGKMTGGG